MAVVALPPAFGAAVVPVARRPAVVLVRAAAGQRQPAPAGQHSPAVAELVASSVGALLAAAPPVRVPRVPVVLAASVPPRQTAAMHSVAAHARYRSLLVSVAVRSLPAKPDCAARPRTARSARPRSGRRRLTAAGHAPARSLPQATLAVAVPLGAGGWPLVPGTGSACPWPAGGVAVAVARSRGRLLAVRYCRRLPRRHVGGRRSAGRSRLALCPGRRQRVGLASGRICRGARRVPSVRFPAPPAGHGRRWRVVLSARLRSE